MGVIGAAPVRRRRLFRLADLPVAAKLGIILVIPLLGLITLTGFAATVYSRQGGRGDDLRAVFAAGASAGRVADGLQRERLALARLLTGGADEAHDAFAAATASTDAAIVRFRADAAGLRDTAPLNRVAEDLDALGDLRTRATTGQEPGQLFLIEYGQIVADLVTFQQGIADHPAPPDIGTAARAAGWLAVAREELAQTHLAVIRGGSGPADQQQLIAHRAAYLDALRRFTADARPAWRTRLDQVPLLAADVSATPDGDFGRQALADLDGLRAVADLVDADTARLAAAARDEQQRTILTGLAIVLAAAAASAGLVVVVGRSMGGALRALQSGAIRVAHERLPQTVRALREADAATAHQLAAQHAATADLPVAGRDEIGRVAEAVNAVQREAVRGAAEQAALRARTSAALVSLARRSQRLVDSLVERLDTAERDEADPDRLAQLFDFDHLATRIRHDQQSLLVLAGVDASRSRRRPVALFDLLRAAQSQILDYARVEYGHVDEEVTIAPEAVDGVAHLLAELFDNAARYSPPDRPVLVDGRRSGDGVVIHVADRGAGLDPAVLEELNQRLAAPPPLDVADAQRMGLAVVARLAARYHLEVSLRAAEGDGLIAVVGLPADLVRVAAPPPAPPAAIRRVLLPHALERSRVLPGAEPVDVPTPRAAAGIVPVVPGADAGPRVEPDGPTVEAEAESVRDLLSNYQHALGRIGAKPVPAANTEGHPAT